MPNDTTPTVEAWMREAVRSIHFWLDEDEWTEREIDECAAIIARHAAPELERLREELAEKSRECVTHVARIIELEAKYAGCRQCVSDNDLEMTYLRRRCAALESLRARSRPAEEKPQSPAPPEPGAWGERMDFLTPETKAVIECARRISAGEIAGQIAAGELRGHAADMLFLELEGALKRLDAYQNTLAKGSPDAPK